MKFCKSCRYYSAAKLSDDPSVTWPVCIHDDFMYMFPEGRALPDIFPEWCPFEKGKHNVPITQGSTSTISIRTYRGMPNTVAVATHVPTSLYAEYSGYQSVYKNKKVALDKLKKILEENGIEDDIVFPSL